MTASSNRSFTSGYGVPCPAADRDYDFIMNWCRKQRQQRAVEEVVEWAFWKWRQLCQENGLRTTPGSNAAARSRDLPPRAGMPVLPGPVDRGAEVLARSVEQELWN